jgi:hypothetical protein
MLLGLLLLVPVVAAADPLDRGQSFVLAASTNPTLAAGDRVDVFVVYNGHARVEGEARSILVVDGTVDLVGGHVGGIVAIRGTVNVDEASVVTGDVRTYESTIAAAPGASMTGRTLGLSPDMAFGWLQVGSVLFFIYLAFAVSALLAGLVLAGLAGRQVRAASALIGNEPVAVLVSAFLGVIGLVTGAILAMVTVVGVPFGVGLLVIVLPALFVVGYIVAGIWLGEQILARQPSGAVRERPYLAAAIGLTLVGAVSIIPPVGGLISFVGFGAVVLLMWRVARGERSAVTDLGRQVAAQPMG